MIYYLFYVLDIYVCSLSITKLSLQPELQENALIRRRMISGFPNYHILSSLSPLSKSGTINLSFCVLPGHL